MKRVLIIAPVVILAIVLGASVFLNGTLIWDGSVYVPISITVFDDERRPIEGASVSLILPRDRSYHGKISDDEYRSLLLSDRRLFETDNLGTGIVGGRFPAGGSSGMFTKRGKFSVVGDIAISHPKFQEFRISLRNLLQAYEFSIDRKKLELVLFLEAPEPSQGSDNLPARSESNETRIDTR